MKILFIHPNMPGQYKHLCRRFADDPNNLVVFITQSKNAQMRNIHKVQYEVPREPSRITHRYMTGVERAVLQGQEVFRVCKKLRDEEGFIPDVICAHPGWGDALYVKDVYPDTPLLSFFEFYYHAVGVDVGFDPEDPREEDDLARVRTKNITNLLNLEAADWGISPTFWQFKLHPNDFKHKISVIHDGIDTKVACPNHNATLKLKDGLEFKYGDEVVTYIARNFEPYRGFRTFMRAAEIIQKERPNAHIVAIGADEVSYGRAAPDGTTYRQMMMKEVKLDMDRIHFVGTQPYNSLIKILQVSAAHIYLTYPFVLSWSALESMAIGCAFVGSATQPVEEVIEHGKTGLLADFFSPREVADRVNEILDHPTHMQEMRDAARQFVVDRYDLDVLLPLHMDLVRDLADKKFPPPTEQRIQALYAEGEREKWAA